MKNSEKMSGGKQTNTLLSTKKRRALLLLAEGLSPADIAFELEIATGTLYNWKWQDEEFRAELARVQSELYSEGQYLLRALVRQAAITLKEAMTADDASYKDKIAAVGALLNHLERSNEPVTFSDMGKPHPSGPRSTEDFLAEFGFV